MKLSHWITVLALLAIAGVVTGCEEEAAEATETPAAEAPPEETGEAAEAIEEAADEGAAEAEPVADEAAEGEAADDSVCGRAQACCQAYVEAVAGNTPGVTVETTCAGVQQAAGTPAADASCQALIDGWRTSFEALPNMQTPGPCQ